MLASEPGLEAGEGVDGRAGAWDPCRRQKVAGRKARMGRRAPGRLLVGPRRGGMGKGAGGQLCAGRLYVQERRLETPEGETTAAERAS